MNKKKLRFRLGFTLIELLVVIMILAILAALIVPRVVNRASDAKRVKAASDIAMLRSLLTQFRLDTDRYPTSEEGLNALRTAPADVRNWRGPYTERAIPADPWNNPYIYEWPGASGDDSFILVSLGSDGQPGGEGDASDITEGLEEE